MPTHCDGGAAVRPTSTHLDIPSLRLASLLDTPSLRTPSLPDNPCLGRAALRTPSASARPDEPTAPTAGLGDNPGHACAALRLRHPEPNRYGPTRTALPDFPSRATCRLTIPARLASPRPNAATQPDMPSLPRPHPCSAPHLVSTRLHSAAHVKLLLHGPARLSSPHRAVACLANPSRPAMSPQPTAATLPTCHATRLPDRSRATPWTTGLLLLARVSASPPARQSGPGLAPSEPIAGLDSSRRLIGTGLAIASHDRPPITPIDVPRRGKASHRPTPQLTPTSHVGQEPHTAGQRSPTGPHGADPTPPRQQQASPTTQHGPTPCVVTSLTFPALRSPSSATRLRAPGSATAALALPARSTCLSTAELARGVLHGATCHLRARASQPTPPDFPPLAPSPCVQAARSTPPAPSTQANGWPTGLATPTRPLPLQDRATSLTRPIPAIGSPTTRPGATRTNATQATV